MYTINLISRRFQTVDFSIKKLTIDESVRQMIHHTVLIYNKVDFQKP